MARFKRPTLAFAAEDWEEATGTAFPRPRSLDTLQAGKDVAQAPEKAVVAAIPLTFRLGEAA